MVKERVAASIPETNGGRGQNLTAWTRRINPLVCYALVIPRFGSLAIANLRRTSAVKLLVPRPGKFPAWRQAAGGELCVPHTHKGEEGHRERWGYHPHFSPLKNPSTEWGLDEMENGGKEWGSAFPAPSRALAPWARLTANTWEVFTTQPKVATPGSSKTKAASGDIASLATVAQENITAHVASNSSTYEARRAMPVGGGSEVD